MRLRLLLVTLVLTLACKKEDPAAWPCSEGNPAPALHAKIEAFLTEMPHYNYVRQGEYEGQTVFIFSTCCPNCFFIPQIYSCQGELLSNSISEEITNQKVIAKGSEYVCTL